MSAFTQIREYGTDIRVVCSLCHLDDPHETWKTANEACRSHNAAQHPRGIQWAQ